MRTVRPIPVREVVLRYVTPVCVRVTVVYERDESNANTACVLLARFLKELYPYVCMSQVYYVNGTKYNRRGGKVNLC